MRDPNRIVAVLKAVELHWRESPDLRLGQLISNLAPEGPYAVEDDDLLRRLTGEAFDEPLVWPLSLGTADALKLSVRVLRFHLRPDPASEIVATVAERLWHEPIPVRGGDVLRHLRRWIKDREKWHVKLGGFGEAELVITGFEYDAGRAAITRLDVEPEVAVNWTR